MCSKWHLYLYACCIGTCGAQRVQQHLDNVYHIPVLSQERVYNSSQVSGIYVAPILYYSTLHELFHVLKAYNLPPLACGSHGKALDICC